MSKCAGLLGWATLFVRERKFTQISELDVGGGKTHFQKFFNSSLLFFSRAISRTLRWLRWHYIRKCNREKRIVRQPQKADFSKLQLALETGCELHNSGESFGVGRDITSIKQ